MSILGEWDSFYVIVGSAAGALIGLQFVVMTLIAENPPAMVSEAGPAFATPTIIHFSVVLLLSALLRIPWDTIWVLAALWGLMGAAGIIYMMMVARRMRRQGAYKPVLEDWLFHILLPFAAYAALAAAAIAAGSKTHAALFASGGSALLLLFVGIHNAWDTIAYQVWVIRPGMRAGQRPVGGAAGVGGRKKRPRR